MTLTRQIFLSGIFVLVFLFMGTTMFVLMNTKTFFNQQLAIHSQDTATALGLTLTTTMKDGDHALAARIIDAIWDRGDFSQIIVKTTQGEIITEKTAPWRLSSVPAWFVKLIAFQPKPAEALIMEGWQRYGEVIVVSNPNVAYIQIWETFKDTLIWLFVTIIIAGLIAIFFLRMILKPLHAITRQAVAICNQEFAIQSELPRTADLRKVVEAMNNMSKRLKTLFEEHASASAGLREQVYKDPITQLANRRYFDLQFEHLLRDFQNQTDSVLMLIEIHDFKKINEKFGYFVGDKLLIGVARAIEKACKMFENAVVTHSRGASFFVILPGKTKTKAESIADNICTQFKHLKSAEISPVTNVGHIGITTFSAGEPKKDIISRADMALRMAQSDGENSWYSSELNAQEIHTASEWIAIFESALKNQNITLFFQEIIFLNDKHDKHNKHYETFVKLNIEEGTLIPAGVFVPIAEQLDLMGDFDKIVIKKLVERIQKEEGKTIYFANLSSSALEDEEFQSWIFQQYKTLSGKSCKLVMELSEQSVVRHLEQAKRFFYEVVRLGGAVSIDHYGNSFSSFSYLYSLKINYLKIDGSFVRNINENEGNQFFIRSLVEIAHSLDIVVLAGMVETENEYHTLQSLSVDGLQGHYISKPSNK